MSTTFGAFFWVMPVAYALAVGAQLFGMVFKIDHWVNRARWAIGAALPVHAVLVAWRGCWSSPSVHGSPIPSVPRPSSAWS